MSAAELIRNASKHCVLVTRLVEEAEATSDFARAALLFGMARQETDNVSRILRQHLARKRPAHELARRKVA